MCCVLYSTWIIVSFYRTLFHEACVHTARMAKSSASVTQGDEKVCCRNIMAVRKLYQDQNRFWRCHSKCNIVRFEVFNFGIYFYELYESLLSSERVDSRTQLLLTTIFFAVEIKRWLHSLANKLNAKNPKSTVAALLIFLKMVT